MMAGAQAELSAFGEQWGHRLEVKSSRSEARALPTMWKFRLHVVGNEESLEETCVLQQKTVGKGEADEQAQASR
jgi:hypothetical protein